MKFGLASMKTLIDCKNPSSNPLQIACCGIQELFRKPEMNFVTCYGITFHNRRMIVGNFKGWIEAPNSLWVAASLVGGGGGEILMRLPVKCLELVRIFKEASRNFKSTFRDVEDVKKFKKHRRLYRKYWFDFYGLQNIIHLVTLSPLRAPL